MPWCLVGASRCGRARALDGEEAITEADPNGARPAFAVAVPTQHGQPQHAHIKCFGTRQIRDDDGGVMQGQAGHQKETVGRVFSMVARMASFKNASSPPASTTYTRSSVTKTAAQKP